MNHSLGRLTDLLEEMEESETLERLKNVREDQSLASQEKRFSPVGGSSAVLGNQLLGEESF